jgi:hypothetical protein
MIGAYTAGTINSRDMNDRRQRSKFVTVRAARLSWPHCGAQVSVCFRVIQEASVRDRFWPVLAARRTYGRREEGAAGPTTFTPPRGDYPRILDCPRESESKKRINRVEYPLNSTR